jgi:rhamnulokinase
MGGERRKDNKQQRRKVMANTQKYLAFDLGAESGRAVVGLFDGNGLRLEDVHRFPTGGTLVLGTRYWDVLRLFEECKKGLALAVTRFGTDLAGIGFDTWGVDFGLLGRGDVLLGNPRHYRDHGNDGMLDIAFALLTPEAIFDRTGIQFMQLNTLYQLLALKLRKSPWLEVAETLLMMPDLLAFWFTGEKSSEFTIASTSQIVDPRSRQWAYDLLVRLGLPTHLFAAITEPGTQKGTLVSEVAQECGCEAIAVYAPAEHDTGSAVVAVPASDSDFVYLSSGTWSLMGIELPQPLLTEQVRKANFTNEGGVCGTTRLLKNIMGLWLVQECRRAYARRGQDHSYAELTQMAEQAPPFGSLIDPDDPSFLAPADMVEAIANFCRRTGQNPPEGIGATVRCCLESLALKYRRTLELLDGFRGRPHVVIHVVGGGTQNRLLCQLTADALQRPVIAGPVEATAIGNVLMQAMGRGEIGSLEEARAIVRNSFPLETYSPTTTTKDRWEEAYSRFRKLCGMEDS